MSISGPCLGVPTLSSSSVTSHWSAVASHLPPTARKGEKVQLGPRAAMPRSFLPKVQDASASTSSLVGTPPADVKAGTAFAGSTSVSMADSASRRDISSSDTFNERPVTRKGDLLAQVKLEIPGKQDSLPATPPQSLGSGQSERAGNASALTMQDTKKAYEKEWTISPSDEKAEAASDEEEESPTLEKKKMKRFRLTHNQTRFLMSEFTRQAHPDAAHRERLSREIPGLTPRQVQVWFQNRRAKLKRLTTNDRQRMLQSRALPDDFDTTRVLRAPFENKSAVGTPVVSPQDYGAPNPNFNGLRALRTDCWQRASEDEYLISPLDSSSTTGSYISPTTQGQAGIFFARPTASASMSDLQRTIRNDYPINRSSSLSDPPYFHPGLHMQNQFTATGAQAARQPGMAYVRQPMDYGVHRHPGGMVTAYDQPQSFEGSVSPTDSQSAQATYDMDSIGPQSQDYQRHSMATPRDFTGLVTGSQIPQSGRHMSSMQTFSVPASQGYRHMSHDESSRSMGTAVPYSQANGSSMSLPA